MSDPADEDRVRGLFADYDSPDQDVVAGLDFSAGGYIGDATGCMVEIIKLEESDAAVGAFTVHDRAVGTRGQGQDERSFATVRWRETSASNAKPSA